MTTTNESADLGLRYLSTLVLGHSEGTAEEIGAAWEALRDRKWTGLDQAALEADIAEDLRKQIAEERSKRIEAERALVVSVPRAEHDVINAQLGEALTAASEERARREAAEAREATLREALEIVADVGDEFEVDGRHVVITESDARDAVRKALASDGSEMLERVRALEERLAHPFVVAAECAWRALSGDVFGRYSALVSMDGKPFSVVIETNDAFLRHEQWCEDMAAENARLKAEVERLTSDLAKANQLLMRATDTIGVLRGVRPVDPEMTQEEALADLDAVAARIRAHLDGKGGGR